jgi:hypothetical protein
MPGLNGLDVQEALLRQGVGRHSLVSKPMCGFTGKAHIMFGKALFD